LPYKDASSSMSKIKTFVANVVATAELGQTIELRRLVNVPGFLYDSAIYYCAYLEDNKTKGKISIFSSGKMIRIGREIVGRRKHV